MARSESLKPIPCGDFIFLNGDVLTFYPKIESFVEIKKLSRYNELKHLLDTSENDLIGEQDSLVIHCYRD